jgi:molybdopterin molybdotransferase
MTHARAAGFKRLTRLERARERLLGIVPPVERTERLRLPAADGRALTEPIESPRDVPGYRRAAMDGYAVRVADTAGAGARSPVVLREDDAVGHGRAVPVHTGSEVPEGTDAVVRIEDCAVLDGGASPAGSPGEASDDTGRTDEEGRTGDDPKRTGAARVEVFDAVAPGENVAPVGEDVVEGQRLFGAGHRLRPSDLGLLRSVGIGEVEVVERPAAAVVPTGEELVESDPEPGETIETNGLTVSRYVERWGGRATRRRIVADDPGALRAAIQRDLTKDLLVLTGGSSVGDRDHVPEVVGELGEVVVHGVGIRPGHPAGFGIVEGVPVLLLPGYPVACIVAAVELLRPALKRAGRLPLDPHPTTTARLDRKLASEVGVRTFARVALHPGEADGTSVDEGRTGGDGAHPSTAGSDADASREHDEPLAVAEPVRAGGAGVLSSVALADGWVVVPEPREGIPAGETVAVEHRERWA